MLKKKMIHSEQELKLNNFMALHNLKAHKIMVALCLKEGKGMKK